MWDGPAASCDASDNTGYLVCYGGGRGVGEGVGSETAARSIIYCLFLKLGLVVLDSIVVGFSASQWDAVTSGRGGRRIMVSWR